MLWIRFCRALLKDVYDETYLIKTRQKLDLVLQHTAQDSEFATDYLFTLCEIVSSLDPAVNLIDKHQAVS